MPRKIHDEQLKLDIIVNGNDAQKKLGDLQQAKRNLKQENDALRKAKAKLVAEGKKETEEFKRLSKQLTDNNKSLKENRIQEQKLTKEIGVAGLTTKQLYSEKKRLKNLMNSFTPNSTQWKEYAKELATVTNRLDQVSDETKEIKKTLSDNKELNSYQQSLSKITSGVKEGDLKAVKSGLTGIAVGIKTVTKSALAFIATPIGATIAALAAVIGAGKMWYDYNIALSKTIKLTEQLTGLQGQELSEYRAQIQGVATTFDQEYNEVLRASNSLAKQMKISQTEALELVEQGFIRGANANGDFLDKVREYPVQFKNAGYSAQEFIDIATQEAKGGIYNDKLVDAIKEADLALKEMTNTQQEALTNAFGQKFTEEIARGISSGELTTKAAINRIITKSEELGLNYQQQQQLIADVFKGAGEDAGGFAEIIFQINEAFEEENKQLTENELATQRLSKATQEHEKVLADLFDASKSGFPAMLTNLKALGQEIFTNTLRGFNLLVTSQEKLNENAGLEGQARAVKDVSENMKLFGTDANKEVEQQLATAKKNIERIKKELDGTTLLGSVFGQKSAREQNLAEAKAYYNELLKIQSGASTKFKEYQEGYKEVSIETNGKRTGDDSTEASAKRKAFEKAEEQLSSFIIRQREQRLLNQKFGLEKELAQIDAKYQKEIDKATKHGLDTAELEKLRDEAKANLTLQRQQELTKKLKALDEQNELEKEAQRLEREALAAETDEEKTQLLLERTQWIANEQLRIEEEKELARLRLISATEEQIAIIKQKFALKRAKVKATFKNEEAKANKLSKKNEDKLNAQRVKSYSDMFGNIASLLGKHTAAGKAAAIAQATMNTYQGITEVWTSKSVLPEPFATAAKVVSTATVLASGLGAVKNITSTQVPGYEDGLYPVTRNDGKSFKANLGTTRTGLVTKPTLMDGRYLAGERSTPRNPEMIIDDVTFSKLDPRIPKYIMDVYRGTVSPGFENGKYNTTSSTDLDAVEFENETTTAPTNNDISISLLERIAVGIESGKNIQLIFGYEDADKVSKLIKEIESSKQNGILS